MPVTSQARTVVNWSSDQSDGFWNWAEYPLKKVRKVVIGPSPGGYESPLQLDSEQSAELVGRLGQMTSMTHLYLWNVAGLKSLGSLPSGLKCLDVRGCPDLEKVEHIPPCVETLVMEQCNRLREWPGAGSMGALISLRVLRIEDALGTLPDEWYRKVLDGCSQLETLDLSGSSGLRRLGVWPPKLRRVILNRCRALENLPEAWPESVYRVELAETLVHRLPPHTPAIDYLNLVRTRNLRALPWPESGSDGTWPRTLYLHGSGILEPPVSEHGESEDQNVAMATRGYFEDIRLAGKCAVRRCKVLMLGNGTAGKTSLSLVLQGMDVETARELGSTHGVKFWQFKVEAKAARAAYHRHIWDFGGQDIYHNAHRLFLSAGAVFVVLWRPEQDGRDATVNEQGYQDVWRPLGYWLDYIRMACPYAPKILVVCNRERSSLLTEAEIRGRFQSEVASFRGDVPMLKIVDLWERKPDRKGTIAPRWLDSLSDVEGWLDESIQQVIQVQGSKVPSHWKIAEEMVSDWLDGGRPGSTKQTVPNQISFDGFRRRLEAAIGRAVKGPMNPYPQLRRQLAAPQSFELTQDRVRRTLAFLSHVGLVFWHHRLIRNHVIVRQEWALDAVYAVLDRRPESPVYKHLRERNGRFTTKDLVVGYGNGVRFWEDLYSGEERDLLLELMLRMGLCFPLVTKDRSYWDEALYLSITHLPSDTDPDAGRHAGRPMERIPIECPSLHEGRWFAVLAHLGSLYGRQGRYARNAFLLPSNNEDQTVRVTLTLRDRMRLGGDITIEVLGQGASELAKQLESHIRAMLDGKTAGDDQEPIAGGRPDAPRVFISYARDEPANRSDSSTIRRPAKKDYTTPVKTLESWAKGALPSVEWIRDDESVEFGDGILRFIDQALERADKILVVHSDRYWLSPYCMYEITEVMSRAGRQGKSWGDLVLMVELETSRVRKSLMRGTQQIWMRNWYADQWRKWKSGVPHLLAGRTDFSQLRSGAEAFLRNHLMDLLEMKGIHWTWDPKGEASFVEWLRRGVAGPSVGDAQSMGKGSPATLRRR